MNNIENFIINECKKLNVELVILDEEIVSVNGIDCNGLFTHNPCPTIYIAKKNKTEFDYYSLLLHEFCHAVQFHEKMDLYLNIIRNWNDDIVDDWLCHRIDLDLEYLQEVVNDLVQLELDCELRVVDLVKSNNLELDLNLYTQKGNAYLLFYKKMIKERKWYKTAPYLIEEIFSKMPIEFKDIALDKYDELYNLCYDKMDEVI